MTDGQFGAVGGAINTTLATGGSSGGTSLLYLLTNAPGGYTLTNIVIYGGWSDSGRDEQAYTLSYAVVGAPTNFLQMTSGCQPPAPPSRQR